MCGRLYLILFFCKFILCPECMYSAVCWCEMFMYIIFWFVLSANCESMWVMFYVYIYNTIIISLHKVGLQCLLKH